MVYVNAISVQAEKMNAVVYVPEVKNLCASLII